MDDLETAPLLGAQTAAAPTRRRSCALLSLAAAAAVLLGAAALAGPARGARVMTRLVRARPDAPKNTVASSSSGSSGSSSSTDLAFESVQSLKDISGMGYLGEGTFIVVHDMKADEDPEWPRVSLIQIPYDLEHGLQTLAIPQKDISWPTDREIKVKGKEPAVAGPNDLESVAVIPGTDKILLCESSNSREDTPLADRIYLAEYRPADAGGPGIDIKDYTTWSSFAKAHNTVNVEGTAVAALADGRYLFLWGERDSMTIRWNELTLDPFGIGALLGGQHGEGTFDLGHAVEHKHEAQYNRPIVGLDVDSETGAIYLVSSNDLEGGKTELPPGIEADNGPYWSMTSIVGDVDLATGEVTIFDSPKKYTRQDGFKVEAVARAQVIEPYDGHDFQTEVPATFIGTDDENYGGTLRKVDL